MPKAIRGFERKDDVEPPFIPACGGNEGGNSTYVYDSLRFGGRFLVLYEFQIRNNICVLPVIIYFPIFFLQ